jgi:hypothetical protein
MAHEKMFGFNVFFVIMLSAMLSIIPGHGFSAGIHIKWDGIVIGANVFGAFDLVLLPTIETFITLISIITGITALAILATIRIVASGLEFSPFKLVAFIVGIVFTGALCAMEFFLLSTLPLVILCVIIFPTQIMMVYSLVTDLGTTSRT